MVREERKPGERERGKRDGLTRRTLSTTILLSSPSSCKPGVSGAGHQEIPGRGRGWGGRRGGKGWLERRESQVSGGGKEGWTDLEDTQNYSSLFQPLQQYTWS